MKNKTETLLWIAAVMIMSLLSGCKKKESIVLYDSAGMQMAEQEAEAPKTEITESMLKDRAGSASEAVTEGVAQAVWEKENVANSEEEKMAAEAEDSLLLVHICGAVVHPGVYEFKEGDRLCHAIEKAGGFLPEADEDYLNQAWKLSDGMQICIPTKEQILQEASQGQEYGVKSGLAQWESAEDFLTGEISEEFSASTVSDQMVNINTASEEVLCTLPGIGAGKAKSIIDYREQNGNYGTIEEIMNVDGIKEGLFQKIKSSITV